MHSSRSTLAGRCVSGTDDWLGGCGRHTREARHRSCVLLPREMWPLGMALAQRRSGGEVVRRQRRRVFPASYHPRECGRRSRRKGGHGAGAGVQLICVPLVQRSARGTCSGAGLCTGGPSALVARHLSASTTELPSPSTLPPACHLPLLTHPGESPPPARARRRHARTLTMPTTASRCPCRVRR